MDRYKGVFLVAGLGMFFLAFVASGILPIATLSDIPYQTLDEIAGDPIPEWRDLAERWPEAFEEAFGAEAREQALLLSRNLEDQPADPAAVAATTRAYAEALDRGRDIYIAEGCWHCHSQYVRGVSQEEERWGPVAMADEFENELQLPQLWGTRRVGPDLSREWGRHTNDWHAAHLWDPKATSPGSVMPAYPWLFEEDPVWQPEEAVRAAAAAIADEKERTTWLRRELARTRLRPNRDGLSLITFLQWLGSWKPERPWNNASL